MPVWNCSPVIVSVTAARPWACACTCEAASSFRASSSFSASAAAASRMASRRGSGAARLAGLGTRTRSGEGGVASGQLGTCALRLEEDEAWVGGVEAEGGVVGLRVVEAGS